MTNKIYFNTSTEANKYIRKKLQIVKEFLAAKKTNRVYWLDWGGKGGYFDEPIEIDHINLKTLFLWNTWRLKKKMCWMGEGYKITGLKICKTLNKIQIDKALHFKLYSLERKI